MPSPRQMRAREAHESPAPTVSLGRGQYQIGELHWLVVGPGPVYGSRQA